jgi:hypothetical protein
MNHRQEGRSLTSADVPGHRHATARGTLNPVVSRDFGVVSGGGGIRTLGTGVTGTTVFETAPFNHSGTSPRSLTGIAKGSGVWLGWAVRDQVRCRRSPGEDTPPMDGQAGAGKALGKARRRYPRRPLMAIGRRKGHCHVMGVQLERVVDVHGVRGILVVPPKRFGEVRSRELPERMWDRPLGRIPLPRMSYLVDEARNDGVRRLGLDLDIRNHDVPGVLIESKAAPGLRPDYARGLYEAQPLPHSIV